MDKNLHILNGDSTLNIFKDSGIEGDTFVWKEVLSNGPVDSDFNSEKFWVQRDAFMSNEFDISTGMYDKEVRRPFENLTESLNQYTEITLWFEYDLFCQINMIALIHWLGKTSFQGTASLVCVGDIDDSGKLYALGEISPETYKTVFENRLKLGSREFDYATDVYEVYTSDSPDDLYNYILMPFGEFPYLPNALESHFRRFPSLQTGLTEIEEQFIIFIQAGESDKMKLIGKMLRWQTHQGFGDLQYINILNRMAPIFKDFDKLELPTQIDSQLISRNYFLGGADISAWRWDKNEETLILAESAS
ncbi:hypothetical protein [Roseivirga misakiensis]|uniref:DUF1835 domain-containing protein n=1 Tax=Roseivirga misakiensis TaxID=1563681 RepID=A0A1E5T4P9_9BACT|nr:hypothetical protein [Roseivirga misakiensis]OEK06311.1 hypothetical protein BFP71_01140 [Roseivirga misakiensis]